MARDEEEQREEGDTEPAPSGEASDSGGDAPTEAPADAPGDGARGGGERAAATGFVLVNWIFYLAYLLLGLRFLLTLLGAREGAGFTRLLHGITDPLLRPFEGILASPAVDNGGAVDFPVLVAILAYGVLHIAIHGLIRTVWTASATKS